MCDLARVKNGSKKDKKYDEKIIGFEVYFGIEISSHFDTQDYSSRHPLLSSFFILRYLFISPEKRKSYEITHTSFHVYYIPRIF